jgi:hypothetical protein
VRTAIRRAAAKIEDGYTPGNHLLHEASIQQHIRRFPTMFAQRASPCELELAVPYESAATGYRTLTPVDRTDDQVLAKHLADALEERTWQDGSTQIPHVPSEDVVERLELAVAEAGLHPLLHRPADLAAKLRTKRLPP